MTRHTQHPTIVAAIAVATLALGACNSPVAPESNTPSATATTPMSSPSTTATKSPEALAADQAEAVYREYLRA